jgi:serine/threonine protein kinase
MSSLNSTFLDICDKKLLPRGGVYGDVSICKDLTSGLYAIEKRAKQNYFHYLSSLSKEVFFLKYLDDEEKKHVPGVIRWKNKIAKDRSLWTTKLLVHYVGPTLCQCKALGFLFDPPSLLKQVMSACEFLEQKKVLHLEIKGDNICFDLDSKSMKLIDFGMAELSLFRDIVNEGGLYSVKCSNSSQKGFVEVDSFFAQYVTPGTIFSQNQLYRRNTINTRLSQHTNTPEHRPPEVVVSQWFDVQRGLEVDFSFDIYSTAYSVLRYMKHHVICGSRYETSPEKERCRLGRLLFTLMPYLVDQRGRCGENEMIIFNMTIKYAMECVGQKLEENPKCVGRMKALEKVLTEGDQKGRLESLAPIYGRGFISAMKGALHPVSLYRSSASDALRLLNRNEEIQLEKTHIYVICEVYIDRYIVCQVLTEDFYIASITIDAHRNAVLWWNTERLMSFMNKHDIVEKMVAKLHDNCCCSSNEHMAEWYSCLDWKFCFENKC